MKDYGIVSRKRLLVKLTRDGRSVYSRSGKQAQIEACRIEGASIASIALSHGVNANLLHKWLRLGAQRPRKAARQVAISPSTGLQATLLPVQLAAPPQVVLAPARTVGLSIVIGDARIVVDGASFDRAALRAVIECLLETAAK
jgi:transposase-like protein